MKIKRKFINYRLVIIPILILVALYGNHYLFGVKASPTLESRVLYYEVIQKYASELGFPPEIAAIIQIRETGWLPASKRVMAVSPAGAIGLQQIMPYHAKSYGYRVADLYNPKVNIEISCKIIRGHYIYYKKDVEKVFAAYNGGRGQANKPQSKRCKQTRNYVKLSMIEWNKLRGEK